MSETVLSGAGVPSPGVPSLGVPSTGAASTGVPSTGAASAGVPSSGVPSSDLPSSGATPAAPPEPGADVVVGDDGRARPRWAASDPLLRDYYDTEWGMPVHTEHELFERLSLEAFQAGLSWALVLRKRPAFRAAFADFDPDVVAEFGEADIARLLGDASIIRNRMKIEATVQNARATRALRDEGGLARLLWSFQPESTPMPLRAADVPTSSPESAAMARALRTKGFRFVGPVSSFALMEAAGIIDTNLIGSHRRGSSGVWAPDGKRTGIDRCPPNG